MSHLGGGVIKVLLADRSVGQLECGRLALTSISSKDMSLFPLITLSPPPSSTSPPSPSFHSLLFPLSPPPSHFSV